MERKLAGRDVLEPELLAEGGPRALMHATERLLARSYGFMYDAVVSGFPPYETLLDQVFAYVDRSAPVGGPTTPTVLDVSCGVGTVAARHAAMRSPVSTPSAIWSMSRADGTAGAPRRSASRTSMWRWRRSRARVPMTSS